MVFGKLENEEGKFLDFDMIWYLVTKKAQLLYFKIAIC